MPDEPAVPPPQTPAEFRAIAKRHDEVADKLESEAALRRQLAELARVSADALEKGLLQPVNISGKVNTNMVNVHRLAISKGRSRRNDAFITHIGTHKPKAYTLRSLAHALGISVATLHAHRKPKGEPNSRPCPIARAEDVKRLTGWPADGAHWPAGLS